MTHTAHVVGVDPLGRKLHVIIGRRAGDDHEAITALAVFNETQFDSTVYQHVPAGTMPPALVIPQDAARALLDALAQHFGGTGDTRQLRKDYDAERTRVDKMINHLIDLSARQASHG